MATFKRFEDILAWQKARKLTQMAYEATAGTQFSRDFGLRSQIQRACVSIMANIIDQVAFDGLYTALDEISRMLVSLSKHIHTKEQPL